MTLRETLLAAGMSPPQIIPEGRWVRFPGIGKGRSNRAGWCRVIAPTLAIYGDWSSSISDVWRDASHTDNVDTARLLREARARERQFVRDQIRRQRETAQKAAHLLAESTLHLHPYLARKGFPAKLGLVHGELLLVPMRDMGDQQLRGVQQITAAGEKRFLAGARARGAIHRLGGEGKTFLCEGYATALSLYEAARRLHRDPAVVVCFSAGNLETVAHAVPRAVVCADHDASGVGEAVARRTGLPWTMPPDLGDFNDLHVKHGLHAVVEVLRGH